MIGKRKKILLLLLVSLLFVTGCEEIIIKDTAELPRSLNNNPLGMQKVRITSEPDGAKIMLISMGNRQMQTFYAPAEINYMVTPAMPTVLTVAKKGYKPKNVRLDGTKDEIHVVLEKAPILPEIDFGNMGGTATGIGGGRGPSMGGAGGGIGPSPGGMAPMDQGTK